MTHLAPDRPLVPVAILTGLLALVLWACTANQPAASTTSSAPSAGAPPAHATPVRATTTPAISPPVSYVDATLPDLMDALVVAPEHLEGYERDLFPHWTDEDGDGCNTRREVLIAQAIIAPSITGSCDLTGGRWLSPYDGVEIDDARGVQIDHLVALAEAWYSGAHAWTTDRRGRFANDIEVPWILFATSPATNTAKGSSDPAEWLPPRPAALCPYLGAWIGTKVRWRLTVDPAEQKVLADLVPRCPDSRLTVPLAIP
jgi:hypothetical protein